MDKFGVASTVTQLKPEASPPDGAPHIEGYRIIRELGSGGMAKVFLATSQEDDRPFAIKVLNATKDEKLFTRFEQEAEIGRSLSHPDIISVYDFGRVGNQAWLAMEYLDGFELAEAMEDDSLGFDDRVNVLIRVALALDYAHDHGVIHRDVKPANIFMTREGGVRLLDFGIARVQDLSITGTGLLVGTPQYMSPEQLTGTKIDRRTDVFALGVVAFELFTGERPWDSDNYAQLMLAVCTIPPASFLDTIAPGSFSLSASRVRQLDAIVHRAISPEASHRYESALAFAEDLEAYLRNAAQAELNETVVDAKPEISREMMAKRRIEWARARAARIQVEGMQSKSTDLAAHEDDPEDRSLLVWLVLVALFVLALVAAVGVLALKDS